MSTTIPDPALLEQLLPEIPQETEGEEKVEEQYLKSILDMFEKEDSIERQKFLRLYRQLEWYFHGIQNIFWDDVAKDWRLPENDNDTDSTEIDPSLYDKIINIFRAHGESIIAALSVDVPHNEFAPDNADDSRDITTAKAYSKAAELIEKHNSAKLLLIEALYTRWIQSFVAGYNYYKRDAKYGSYETTKQSIQSVDITNYNCPDCGAAIPDSVPPEADYSQPPSPLAGMGGDLGSGELQNCPNCGPVSPIENTESIEVPIEEPVQEYKGRECLEVYGPRNVKIAPYAKKFEDSPYLILETEAHLSQMQDVYPEKELVAGGADEMERWARLPSSSVNQKLVTVKRVWLRPWAYNQLGDKDQIAQLKALFPKGVYFVVIQNVFCESLAEDVDEHWTISQTRMSPTLHDDPLGKPLVPVQEIKNDLIAITIETINYGIPETFVDNDAIDLDAYGKVQHRPGMLYGLRMRGGQNADSLFYTSKSATLSDEVPGFDDRIDAAGQFLVSDFPSVFGGQQKGGSETLGEYEQSRAQSLQRLSLTWKSISEFWCNLVYKATKEFLQKLKWDEKFVKKVGRSYVNIWVRQDELGGKIGEAIPEPVEQFPVTWAQKKALILQILNMGSPELNSALFMPENTGLIADILGVHEFTIPGEADREKQLKEITEMLNSPPQIDPLSGQPLSSSIPVDQYLDNHQIEAEICRSWLISEEGLDAKTSNPEGYQNVYMHWMEHYQVVMMQQQMQAEQDAANQDGKNKPGEPRTQSQDQQVGAEDVAPVSN